MQFDSNRVATDRQLAAQAAHRRARYLRREIASGALPLALTLAYLEQAERLEQLFPDDVDVRPAKPRPRQRLACQQRRH